MEFAAIDYLSLAQYLAQKEWEEKYEAVYPFTELYEQVDESGEWYMKGVWKSLYDVIEEKWQRIILEYDILNTNIGL